MESSAGDAEAAELRLDALQEIPILSANETVEWVASELACRALIPPAAAADGFHIAYASIHKISYLLTWNCKHIANAERLPAVESFLAENGYHVPIVCTPEELMGDDADDAIS